MSDPKIRVMGKTKVQQKNHVDYHRKRKNEAVNSTASKDVRQNIIDAIETARQLDDNDQEEITDTFVNDDDNDIIVENHSIEGDPSLSARSSTMHQIESEPFADIIYSDDIESADDYHFASSTIKDRAAIRNNRVKHKVREHNALLNDIRDQKEERREHNIMQQFFMGMLMHMQQQDRETQRQEREDRRLMQQQILDQMRQQTQKQQFMNMMMLKFLGMGADSMNDKKQQE